MANEIKQLCGVLGLIVLAIAFLIVLPIGGIITGFVFVVLPNNRKHQIIKFNEAVSIWKSDYLPLVKAYDASQLSIQASKNPFILENAKHVQLGKLRSKYDSIEVSDWESCYFSSSNDYGPRTFDPAAPKMTLLVNYPNASIAISNSPFLQSGTHFSGSDWGATSPSYRCGKKSGTYHYAWGWGDNCFWYYAMNRMCLLLDIRLGTPAYMNLDAEAVQSPGCFYKAHMPYGDTIAYPSASYAPVFEKYSTDHFVLSTEIRSQYDPEIILARLTAGKNDFGWTKFTYTLSGILMMVYGVYRYRI